jgi:transketolase
MEELRDRLGPTGVLYRVFAEPGQMRKAFGEALAEQAAENPDIVVLTPDVAWPTCIDLVQRRYPERFFNLGVAEQNAMGMAAGFANAGMVPFVTMFAIFASTRASEQMRTSIAYPRLNVKIAGSYAGLSAEGNGPTHFSVEDISIMRAIPNMTVVVPCDCVSVRKAVAAAARYDGPLYLRVSRSKVAAVYDEGNCDLVIGKAIELRRGTDATIIAAGTTVAASLAAASMLEAEGVSTRVLDSHTVKPIDQNAVLRAAEETHCIVTVEESNVLGGLGGAVAEVVAERAPVPVVRLGLRDTFAESGDYEALMEAHGLTPAGIAQGVRRALDMARSR